MNRPAATLGLALALVSAAAAQTAAATAAPAGAPTPAANRVGGAPVEGVPPLAFREEFNDAPGETPITQKSIKNKELSFATYGPGKDGVDKTYHPNPPNEGGFMWTGACTQLCGFTLYLPKEYVDLRGQAKIVWRTEQTGLHVLRLMIKTADGKMYVSDRGVGWSSDWQVSELSIRDLNWRELDVVHMNDASSGRGSGQWAPTPDLSKVAEVGWTDLQAGSGHGTNGGSSRVDWVEVYGKRVPR